MTLPRHIAHALIAAAAVLVLAVPAWAGYALSGERSVSFRAVGPVGLAIEGKGKDIKLREREKTLSVVVGLSSLETGISLRDRHMREKYLETHKFPTAILHVEKTKIQFPTSGRELRARSNGKLTLHGVTRPVSFTYSASGSKKRAAVESSFSIKMTDYGIEIPSYLGVSVKPKVDISVRFQVVR